MLLYILGSLFLDMLTIEFKISMSLLQKLLMLYLKIPVDSSSCKICFKKDSKLQMILKNKLTNMFYNGELMYIYLKIQIEEIFIKDIQLSKELQEALSSATKERRFS